MSNPPKIDPSFQEEWDELCKRADHIREHGYTGERTCLRCGETKDISEYYTSYGIPQVTCKKCVSTRIKERAREKKEKKLHIAVTLEGVENENKVLNDLRDFLESRGDIKSYGCRKGRTGDVIV